MEFEYYQDKEGNAYELKTDLEKLLVHEIIEQDKEIERLNKGCKELEKQVDDLYKLETALTSEIERLNNIINELEKYLIEYFKKEYPDRKLEDYNLEYCTYDYALVILGKLQELRNENDKK